MFSDHEEILSGVTIPSPQGQTIQKSSWGGQGTHSAGVHAPVPDMDSPTVAATKVLLVDDHRLLRAGLRHLLGLASDLLVQAEADGGLAALAILGQQHIDVAVVDLSMPGLSGIALVQKMKAEHPQVALLVLTMHAEEHYAVDAFRAGANGYLTKDVAADELVNAIRKVASGGAYVTPALAERLALDLNRRRTGPPHLLLSEREFAVFRWIVEGRRLTEIADAMGLSVKTVSTHKSHILEKMQLVSSAELVRYAMHHGLFGAALA
jgi:DNA-binding NarL/FixJ family response regulator